jgi:adenylate cyclase
MGDLRGFTAFSEAHPADVVLEVLDAWLVEMARVVADHGGMVDKFMGDSVMALFGAERAADDDAQRATVCAVRMQLAMLALNSRHRARGLPPAFMGIGINTGLVSAGRFGSDQYSAFTVVGDAVNVASRIEAVSLRGQVLVSESTYALCGESVAASPPTSVVVKGRAQPVGVREVHAVPALGLQVPRQELRRSPRVQAPLPFSYRAVENGVLGPAREAVTLDLGYHGLLARVAQPLAPHGELRLELPLPLLGHVARNVYARVVKCTERDGASLAAIEFTAISEADAGAVRRLVQMLV